MAKEWAPIRKKAAEAGDYLMVTVKVFGLLRLETGIRELQAEAGRVQDIYPLLMEAIRRENPDTALTEKMLHACLIAVNGKKAGFRTRLNEGDVVYLFPAAAGG